MEKFIYLFRGGMGNGSPEIMQSQMQKWLEWIERLTREGKYLAGEPLMPGGKQLAGTQKTVTDGPFVEGKEVVGGFFMINASSYEEAVEIAKDFPEYNYGGTVEVRQVMKM
jgi:hypothetical protein